MSSSVKVISSEPGRAIEAQREATATEQANEVRQLAVALNRRLECLRTALTDGDNPVPNHEEGSFPLLPSLCDAHGFLNECHSLTAALERLLVG